MFMKRDCLTRRNFLKTVAGGAALAISGCFGSRSSANSNRKDKPNIIYIMADDLGYGDLGCYGATKIRTPNIDSLAKEGIRLTDAHTPSAVCSPTRYGVLTGRYCWRGRLKKQVLWSGYDRCLIEPGRKTIGNMMQESGYRTAQIGKWHLGWGDTEPVDYSKGYLGRGPKDLGFGYSFVTAAAQNLFPLTFVENHKIISKLKPMDYYVHDPKVKKRPQNVLEWHKSHDKGPSVIAEDWQPYHVDKIYTDKAIRFITEHVNKKSHQPFYLHLTPETTHRPNIMPEFMRGTSQAGMRGDHIQLFDWMVGQIVKTIKELKVDQNTLIIVTSDNGPTNGGIDGTFGHESAGKLRGYKWSIWDGGHRVPFIARWPGKIKPATESDTMICLTDMMATFAAITDYKLSSEMGEDSFNAFDVLLGKTEPIRDSIIHHDFSGNFAIRKGPWKLVGSKLFNIKQDIKESRDLAKENPQIVTELKKLLAQQRKNNRTK